MPMMSVVDKLARAAADYSDADVLTVTDLILLRWLPVRGGVRAKTCVTADPADISALKAELWVWRKAATSALSRFELVARATVRTGTRRSAPVVPFAPLTDSVAQADPYASGVLFHGPSFQYLTRWALSSSGGSGVLEVARGRVPRGMLHQGLLDGALHVIPAQSLWQWTPTVSRGLVAIPHRLDWLELYEPLPDSGEVNVEARFTGLDGSEMSLPSVEVQLSIADRVAVAFRLVLGLLTLGPLADATPADRRAFLSGHHYVPGVELSRHDEHTTALGPQSVSEIDWPPGAIADIYALPTDTADRIAVIAAKEHIARMLAVHPSSVTVAEDLSAGWIVDKPEARHHIALTRQRGEVQVRSVEGVLT
jgi:hypothetical protein